MNNNNNNLHLSFSSELLFSFHEFSETTTVVDELEELYKSLYNNTVEINSDLSIPTSSLPVLKGTEEVKVLIKPSKTKRSKIKKPKNKRVEHVTAEDGVLDQWSWRKYGQKPIKGSPYPRSYYRCSSSKGCLAKKQVERSYLDPEVFIVTYTAEHSIHPHPTRKNSQHRKNISSAIALLPIAQDHQSFSSSVVELEQSGNGKKEENVVEGDGWFSMTELEELIELDNQRQLAFDGHGFMDSTFSTQTCFG